jgi:hypothetical protein
MSARAFLLATLLTVVYPILVNAVIEAQFNCSAILDKRNFDGKERAKVLLHHPSYANDFISKQTWTRQWIARGVSYYSNESVFYAIDAKGFYAKGFLTERGELLTDLRLQNSTGRAQHMRGSEIFDEIVSHFGPRIKTVVGYWQSFGPSPSTNFVHYHYQISPGWTRPSFEKQVDAALSTWTGKHASRYGFNNVLGVYTEYIFEGAGQFDRVIVLFGR